MQASAIAEPAGSGQPPESAEPQSPAVRIFRHGRIDGDAFVSVADDQPTGSGAVIVSLERFLRDKAELLSRGARLGVRLSSTQSPECLSEDIGRLALVEIRIVQFRDGRAFSWARLLRTRLHFAGEIRISGHFLLDQIAFFLRLGVESFVVPETVQASEIRRVIGMISISYQPSPDGRPTIRELRHRQQTQNTARPLNS